ncbi:MAG: hypothetical protein WBM40_03740 [Thiohalocapsa sp.]
MSIRTSTFITAILLGLVLNAGTMLGQLQGGGDHVSVDAAPASFVPT